MTAAGECVNIAVEEVNASMEDGQYILVDIVDLSTGAVRYRLSLEEEADGNLLHGKKRLFIPPFSVLMALCLPLFLFAITARRRSRRPLMASCPHRESQER